MLFLFPLFLEKSGAKNRSLIIFFSISSSARRPDLQTRSRTNHRYALWISLLIALAAALTANRSENNWAALLLN